MVRYPRLRTGKRDKMRSLLNLDNGTDVLSSEELDEILRQLESTVQ